MTNFPEDHSTKGNTRIGSRAAYNEWFKSKEGSIRTTKVAPEDQSSWVNKITEENGKIKGDDGIER